MSFIGNIAGAQSAKAIGKYNAAVATQQANYLKAQAEVQKTVYNQIERPRFLDQQKQAYSNFFVSLLNSGAEFRPGDTTFLTAIKNKQLQSFDLALADYNQKVAVNDTINQSLLMQGKAQGELFKGKLTANTEYAKAAGSLLSMGYQSQQAGKLVIV